MVDMKSSRDPMLSAKFRIINIQIFDQFLQGLKFYEIIKSSKIMEFMYTVTEVRNQILSLMK